MQHSELLETTPPLVFQSVFPLHTKSSAHVWALDSDTTSIISSSHARAAESPLPQEIHIQGGREDKGHCPRHHIDQENHSLAHSPSNSQQMTAQQTCSEHPIPTMAWLVIFLTTPYSRSGEKSWKEWTSYLSLVLLIARLSQNPSWTTGTQLGLRILTAPLLGG